MSKYSAFIDESGCKQRARTPVLSQDDFGVAIGIAVPSSQEDAFCRDVVSAARTLGITLGDETHLTDIDSKLQEHVRNAVYAVIKCYNAELYWQALLAAGFQYGEVTLVDAAIASAKAATNPNINIVGNPDNPSAHAELLAGVMAKVLSAHDRVAFKTDEVDVTTLKEAKQEVEAIFGPYETAQAVNAYDKAAGRRLKGAIVSKIDGLDCFPQKTWTLDSVPKHNGGVFAADVISNSLWYHLKNMLASGANRLNDKSAIRGFALASQFRCGDGEMPDIADTIYAIRSPKNLQ